MAIEKAYRVQFKDILIPRKYFFDYLRGCFDGDGCIYSYWDKRWKSSFMYYLIFGSASREHIEWLRNKIFSLLKISGHVTSNKNYSFFQLKYAKLDSLKILKKMYNDSHTICLGRKKLKIDRILDIVGISI